MNSLARQAPEHDGLLLPGLDGSNPLGFLAALGVLRTLAQKSGRTSVVMKWVASSGTLVPRIRTTGVGTTNEAQLLEVLEETLPKKIENHPVRILKALNTDAEEQRRAIFLKSLGNSDGEAGLLCGWLAALASDFTRPEATNQLQTARRDYYYDNLAAVIANTKREHLRRSLFCCWDYADALDNQSLHLDPSEDRRHAYQWNKPSGDPNRKKWGGMIGANRLAIEAFPLFTSLPENGTLRTMGFSGSRSTDTRWTWPVWGIEATIDVVWSLLLAPELQREELGARQVASLRERRVSAIYRTYRILVGKTPNFTPARRIA
jgi:CRISPR-associated endonuclease/helicase Cas3